MANSEFIAFEVGDAVQVRGESTVWRIVRITAHFAYLAGACAPETNDGWWDLCVLRECLDLWL